MFKNCVPKRQSELQTWRNTQINEWINGTPSVTAFDECLQWFIEINGDHIRSEEAGADYDSMKTNQHSIGSLQNYHQRFNLVRQCTDEDQEEPVDSDVHAARKLRLSNPDDLQQFINRQYHDIEVQRLGKSESFKGSHSRWPSRRRSISDRLVSLESVMVRAQKV